MKKILFVIFLLNLNFNFISAKEIKCDTALSKLKPKCNFVGKGMEKMKSFSEKNKTLDQSYENIKTKSKSILEKIKK